MKNIFTKFYLSLLFAIISALAWAQPANDNCNNATSIGSLPTPGACSSGLQDGATVTLSNQTTVGATGANPYTYLTGCSGGGNMQSPALDVWYSFTATGTSLNFAINGFPNASVGVWTGTNCNSLTGVSCTNIGGGGNGTLVVPTLVIGNTYYIQISGGSTTATDNNFSITLDNDTDCNNCLRQSTLTATPAPVGGAYSPGQVVRFCYTVTQWEQTNTNWFHGVQITMGPGWTGTISNATPAATCQNVPGPGSDGDWIFFPSGYGSWGPGFYFDTPDSGTDASDNFGDNCSGTGLSWTFCWDLTVSSTCVAGQNLGVTVNTSGDGESGSWSNVACQTDAANTFTAVMASGPVMTSANTATICSSTSVGLALTANQPSTFSWVATANPNVTGESTTPQSGATINNVLVNTTSVPQVVVYTVTPTSNPGGCLGTPQTVNVTVNPPSIITLTSAVGTNAQTVCANNAITPITYSIGGSATGATVAGLPAGVTGSYAAGVFTISGSPTTPGVYNYTVTTTGGCAPAVTATGTITVTVSPTLTLTSAAATANQTVCQNVAIANITYAVGGGATGATVVGLPAGVTGSYAAGVFTISGTPTASGTFNYTVTTTGGCAPAATATGTITVTPLPIITLTSAAATTNQTVCQNVGITNITYSVTNATGATVVGLPAGVTGSYAAGVFTISGTPTASGTFNYTVTTTGGCAPAATATGTITVTPLPIITLTSAAATTNQTVCQNVGITNIAYSVTNATGATVVGLPAGVTGSYAAGVFTISGTPTASGTFNYTVTTTGGCAPAATATGTITVTPLPIITLTSAAATTNQTVCQNVGITAITYSVTNATGATVVGLPAGVTGSYAAGVFTISGTPTVSGTFNYTVTTTGGCAPAATATGAITVTPLPIITLTSAAATTNQTVCQNVGITNITYSVTNATGATVVGLPAGVTGSYAAGVFTISGTPTVSGTFNYTVTTTGGCAPAATATGTITVTPLPIITLTSAAATTNQTVCQNVGITAITYSVTNATGATVVGLPAGVTGSYAAGVFTISGTPTASGTFNYTVTTTGGCAPAATATGTITVTPLPIITLTSAAATTNQTVCQNVGITAITYSVTNATGATVVGLPAGVTGSYVAGVFTISGTPTASGTFNYTVTTTGGCAPAATATGTITVTPLPIITLAAGSSSQTVCINTPIANISYNVTNATGATVAGLPAGVTGSYAAGVFTISGTPTASGTFNYTVTTTGGCAPAATATGTITVNSAIVPITGFSYPTPVCQNAANPTPTGVAGFTTGGTYSSTSGLVFVSTSTGEINLVGSTPGTYIVTYTYPASACGMAGSSTFSITINALPAITLTSAAATTNQTVCQNVGITAITYSVANATGATVAGLPAGVTGSYAAGVFTISGTPTASGTFNYTVTTTGGCAPAATATGTITVTPLPIITLTSAAATTNQTVCQNVGITAITYSVTNATGATVVGLPAGVTGSYAAGVFTISGTPTASGTFNYTVTTTGGCAPAATATGTITVTPLPAIVLTSAAATANQTVCQNVGITAITYSVANATGATVAGLPAGVTGSYAAGVFTISGTPTASGTFNYTVTTTGGCAPAATATGTITVTPLPIITLTSAAATTNQTVCQNVGITAITYSVTNATGATVTGLPAGVTGSYAAGVFTISGTPTASGTFNYTVTTTGGCAPAATATGTITVTPLPIITLTSAAATTNQTVCQNVGITNITYSVTNATGATVVGLPAGVTGSYAAGVFTISGTPTASGTFNYTVTTTGGCAPDATATGTITVTPLPIITLTSAAATTNQTVCQNVGITNITYSVTNATGATVVGLPAGVTGSYAAGVFTISGTPTVSGTFNYTVTTTGGCAPAATATGTITVTPLPIITLTSAAATTNQTVCQNVGITAITYSVTNATGATVVGLPAGVTGSYAAGVFTISGTPTASGTFNYTVTTTGGCAPDATATGTITVTPLPAIALTSAAATTNQTVCQNTAIAAITYNVTNATGATVAGLPAGVTGSYAAGVFTISGSPTSAGSFNYTVTTTGGCAPAVTATGTINVNPSMTPVTGFSYPTPVCQNVANPTPTGVAGFTTGGTYSSTPGLVFVSTSTGEIDLAGSTAGTYTVTYTYPATICGPMGSSSFNITITALPAITLTSAAATTNQTVCQNVGITNITYSVTNATGATVVGLPTGVTGSYAAGVFTISGTPTASGTFNYTVTTTGGCAPDATATGTITVTPLPIITLTSAAATTNQTVCQNVGITAITYSVTNATGATVVGLPAGVTGSYAAGVFTISGTPTASGTFNYTVTTTGGCAPDATATGTITVTPLPAIALTSVAATANQTVCQNVGITAITYSVTNATGATVVGLPAGVTGSYAAGVFTISGTPTASGTFNYTVTTTGGCAPDATATGTITVTPLPAIVLTSAAATANQTVCQNVGITAITYSVTNATGATVTGLPAGVTGSYAAGVFTISGTPTVSGTFNYTVTTTGGCAPDATATGTITVTPLPAIALTSAAATANQTVCQNVGITAITYSVTNATGATVTGLPAGVTGSYAAGVFTISGTPTASGTFNYTVTTTGGCAPAATATGTITVTPLPIITLTSAAATTNQTVCQNVGITAITYSVTNATGATVAGLPAGVTGSYAAGVFTISGTPTVSGTFNYTVTTTGGCAPDATATGTITVTPLPAIALTSAAATANQTVCQNVGITAITYSVTNATGATVVGLPAGVTGSYAAGVFTISGTPTASGTFNYTVTTTGGCAPDATATGTITVTPLPAIALTSAAATANQTVCQNVGITAITYSVTNATGATVTGLPAGVTGSYAAGAFTISGTPTASGTFNYTVTTTGGCAPDATATGTITVTPLPAIALTSAAATANQTVCQNVGITAITYSVTNATGATVTGLPAGVTGSYAAGVFTISGSPTASGTFNYTVTTTGGCAPDATATGTITVTPLPVIALTSAAATTNQTVCINTAIAAITYSVSNATGATVAGLPAGVTGSYAAGAFTISGTPTASGTFNYTVTTTGGCAPDATATGTITVTPLPAIALTSAAATANQTVCQNVGITAITYSVTNATGATVTGLPAGVTGSYAAGVFTISGTPTASGTFNYMVTTTGGCAPDATATGTITVTPLPVIALTSAAATTNQTVCINTAIAAITYSVSNATGATVAGLPAGVTGSYAAGVFTISGTPTASGTFNYTVTTTGGCAPAATATGTIIVTPNNTVGAASSTPTLCINTVMTAITHSTTGGTGIGAASGLPTGVTASWAPNAITISGTPTVSGTFSYSIPLTGGCGTVFATGTITVTPDNTVSAASSNPALCINTAMTTITHSTTGATGIGSAMNLPLGVTASWNSDVITISGTPTVAGVFNYSVPLTGGCGNLSATGTITVYGLPVLTATATSPICNNESINVTFSSNVPGTTYTWSATTSNINGSYPSSGDETNINQAVQLIDPMVAGSITFDILPTANGCNGEVKRIEVIVNPIPVITPPTVDDTEICTGESVTIDVNGTPAGIVYHWQVINATNAQVAGGVTSGTSTTGEIEVVLEATTNTTSGTIQFEITPVRNGCTGQPETTPVITVHPTPGTPIPTTVFEICTGGSTNIRVNVLPLIAGTNIEWEVVNVSNVTGATPGSGPITDPIVQQLTNNSTVVGTVTYRVKTELNGCYSGTTDYIVEVHPLPNVTLPERSVICIGEDGEAFTSVLLDTGLSEDDYAFDWTLNGTPIVGGSSILVDQTSELGEYSVIVTSTDPNNPSCPSEPVTSIVEGHTVGTISALIPSVAFDENGSITVVMAGGTGGYLYALSPTGPWQASNVFTNLNTGNSYTVYVTDENGCTSDSQSIYLISYPHFFTPNGDGANDTWNIWDLEDSNPMAEIYIFDRYGKLIKQIVPKGNGWDGTYNGEPLPSTDYWFTVKFLDPADQTEKVFKAHFSMKR